MDLYQNPNIFLVEILGFTHHCSLRCDYCDWIKQPISSLTRSELLRVRQHLEMTRNFIQQHYPAAQVIEYSGGEPYVHPEVVEYVLDIFQDYWVRINTNGLHLNPSVLKTLRTHGRAYLALSLDGHTLEANRFRIQTAEQLERIVRGLEHTLEEQIPVALLCTLHARNIDEFPDFLRWLEQCWLPEIEAGRLMIAAHRLTVYNTPHPVATPEQQERMQRIIEHTSSPLLDPIREHYRGIWNPIPPPCGIHRWAASIHFLGDALATTGKFTSFRCGMRGIGPIGEFVITEEMEQDQFSCIMKNSLTTDFQNYLCSCYVDWRAFDMFFSGIIPLRNAKNWFLPLRTPQIQEWIINYLDRQKGEGMI